MALYPIKNLGALGVIADIAPTDIPPNAFTDAMNARFVNNHVVKMGGNHPISYQDRDLTITPFSILPMPFDFDSAGNSFNIVGTATSLYQISDQRFRNLNQYAPNNEKTATFDLTVKPVFSNFLITEYQKNVKVGQSYEVVATIEPQDAEIPDVVWTMSTTSYGTISVVPTDPSDPTSTTKSLKCLFTANTNRTGQVSVIISKKSDPTVYDRCMINVVPNTDQVFIDQVSPRLRIGDGYFKLTALFGPNDVPADVDWSVSDQTMLEIIPNDATRTALIKPKDRTGIVNVTVRLRDNPSISGVATVSIGNTVDSVIITPTTFSANVGQPREVELSFFPDTATNKTITWTTDPPVSGLAFTQADAVNRPNFWTITGSTPGIAMIAYAHGVSGTPGQVTVTINAVPAPAPIPFFDAADVVDFGLAPPPPSHVLPEVPSNGTFHFSQPLPVLAEHTEGTNFDFGVDVEGFSGSIDDVTFLWYKNGVAHTTFNPHTRTISYSLPTTADSAYWQVVATDHSGASIVSNLGEVRVIVAPSWTPVNPGTIIKPPYVITGLSLTAPKNIINVGEDLTITSHPVPTPDPDDHLVYIWTVNKNGIIYRDVTFQPTLQVTGIGKGDVRITLQAFDTTQELYTASDRHPWYHAVIANCAVATTYNHPPMVKEFASDAFVTLPGWGEQTEVDTNGDIEINKYSWFCERVRAFNNRLFALNMRETNISGVATHYPLRLRWSNFADENKAPTLWDDLADLRDPEVSSNAEGTLTALQNGYAGYIDLADSNGNLIDMLPLKDYLFIYTEYETYVATPTMNAYQPMTFKKLFNDSGILAPGCACEVEGGQLVVTQNDIIVHNGATKRSIATGKVRNKIINEIMSVNPSATKVHLHSDKNEVWILYVVAHENAKDSKNDVIKMPFYCNKAAVWNYEFDTWTFCDIPFAYDIAIVDPPSTEKGAIWNNFFDPTSSDIAYVDRGLNQFGEQAALSDPSLKGLKWSDIKSSSNATGKEIPWQKNFSNFKKRITAVASALGDAGFYQVDDGTQNSTYNFITNSVMKRPLRMYLERSGLDFDNITEDWRQKHLNYVRPQFTGTGKLMWEFGGTQFSNEIGHKHDYRPFVVGVDRNKSVRLNHPYLYYRLYEEDEKSKLTINGLTLDFQLGGRR